MTAVALAMPDPDDENEQAIMRPEPKGITPALSALPDQAIMRPEPTEGSPGRVDEMRGHTFDVASLAETVTDIERARIAAENRHRSWVQSGAGGTAAEQQAAAIVEALAKVEHDATLALQRAVRRHPLGPFVKRTVGLGEKQGARLIAAIGDPWWNTLHDRPRTVSELWAYTGFHVLHPGQLGLAAQGGTAGVDPSRPSHTVSDPLWCPAGATPLHPGHSIPDSQLGLAGVDPSRSSHLPLDSQETIAGATPLHPGQILLGAQVTHAGVDPSAHPDQTTNVDHVSPAGVGGSAVTGHPSDADPHVAVARDGDLSCSPPSPPITDAHARGAGVAARRRKGQKANWSNEAKMRARLCAESCIKQAHSPYRPVYDASRAADAGRGLTPLHEHNRALRKVAKALLKDLWREARDWHTEAAG